MHKMITVFTTVCITALTTNTVMANPGEVPFKADVRLEGSSLEGWQTFGQASWSMQDGVITGRPRSDSGGWLMLDKKMANIGAYSKILCPKSCKAGLLLRAEKTADGGLKGIYVALSDAERGIYAITVDANGRETSRKPVEAGHSLGGLPKTFANTPPHIIEHMKTRKEMLERLGDPQPKDILAPMIKPLGEYAPGAWNSVNVYLYQDSLNPSVNGAPNGVGALPQSIVAAEDGTYGAVALYVGGKGSAQFKDVRVKDLMLRTQSHEKTSSDFHMLRLDSLFYSWSPAVGDFNRDGKKDIAAGSWIYYGPDFTKAQEYYVPTVYNPTQDYPQVSTVALSADFTGDGWDDVIQFTGNAGFITGVLYVNPQGQSRPWDKHQVLDLLANEDTMMADIDGDGVMEVIHGGPDFALGYSKPDPANPTGKWITTVIAKQGLWGDHLIHGVGVGDINGDGRNDFVSPYGWFEQPADKQGLWTFHPVAFGRSGISQGGGGGARLGVWDVNGDGLNDVVTPLEGHGFGLAWYEHKLASDGSITFVQHIIMDGFEDKNAGDVMFTQPHAANYADMNGDGILDIVTGKRLFSHLSTWYDPDPYGEPVLYIYHVVRNPNAPGGAEFVPHLVHNMSGVGAQIMVEDMNNDGKPDIQTSGPLGSYVFINKTSVKIK